MRPSIFVLLACLLLLSCQRFHKKFESIAVRCGVEPAQMEANRVALALVTESGEAPSASVLQNLALRLVRQDGSKETLSASPGGCVFVKAEDVIIQGHGPDSGLHFSFVLKSEAAPPLQEVTLRKKRAVDFQIQCPRDGFYSRNALSLPLSIRGQGSLESLNIKLMADEHTIAEKPYGEAVWDLPPTLDLSALPAGLYRLKLSYENSMDAWDSPAPDLADCSLTLQREAPAIEGLDLNRRKEAEPLALKQGELLNWYARSKVRADLRSCREEVAADEDAIDLSKLSCAPRAQCLDERNFEIHEQKRADASGLFHYFLYAEDWAGNRSEMHCERLLVSASAPQLSLAWSNPKWNVPLSVMDEATLTVSASATVTHVGLADRRLLERLECKVEFYDDNAGEGTTSVFANRDVLCTSESCRGRTLDQYQTCGPDIQFNLARFWTKERNMKRLRMQLSVRSSDGAGHVEEASRSVYLYPERFKPLPVPAPADSLSIIKEARDGTIYLLSAQKKLYAWNESTKAWDPRELVLPEGLRMVLLLQDAQGELYVQWKKSNTELGLLVLRGQSWEPLPDHPIFRNCATGFNSHPEEGLYCSYGKSSQQWYRNQWQPLDIPKSCQLVTYVSSDLVSCQGSKVFQKTNGEWKALPQVPKDVMEVVRDARKRVWVLGSRLPNSNLTNSLHYLEDGQWKEVTARPKSLNLRTAAFLYADPKGLVYYNDSVFDESQQSWTRPKELELAFPEVYAKPGHDYLGRSWFKTPHGLAYMGPRGWQYFPTAAFGITDPIDYFVDRKGRLWTELEIAVGANPVMRFEPINWHFYREEAGIKANEAYSQVTPLTLDADGLPLFLFSHGGLMRGTPDGWQKLSSEVTADGSPLYSFVVNGQGEILGHDLNSIFAVENGAFRKLASIGGIFDFQQIDAKGRAWFYRSSSRDVYYMDNGSLVPVPLPNSFAIVPNINILFLPEKILVPHGDKFLKWNEASQQWGESLPADEGLPSVAHILRQVGPDHILVQPSKDAPLELYTQSGHEMQTIPAPPVDPKNGNFRFTHLGLLFMNFDSGVFLYHKDHWIWLMSPASLLPRLDSTLKPGFLDGTIDRWNRLWVQGRNHKLLRMDLNPDDLDSGALQ